MRKPIVAVTADTLLSDMKPINQRMADYAARRPAPHHSGL